MEQNSPPKQSVLDINTLITHIKALSEIVADKKKEKPELTKLKALISASGLFQENWYLKQYPDVLLNPNSGADPLRHYIEFGGFEGRKPNRYFDSAWYLEKNKDVRDNNVNPLIHFINHGAQELRNPGPEFNVEWYLKNNSDLAESKLNPLAHYLFFGEQEGRKCKP